VVPVTVLELTREGLGKESAGSRSSAGLAEMDIDDGICAALWIYLTRPAPLGASSPHHAPFCLGRRAPLTPLYIGRPV